MLVSVLMRNGYDVEIGPELPDPPFRFESFIIATPGWGPAVGLDGLIKVLSEKNSLGAHGARKGAVASPSRKVPQITGLARGDCYGPRIRMPTSFVVSSKSKEVGGHEDEGGQGKSRKEEEAQGNRGVPEESHRGEDQEVSFLWSGIQVPRAVEQALHDMQRESNKSGVIGLCGAVHGRKDLIRGPGKARPFHSGKASLSNQF